MTNRLFQAIKLLFGPDCTNIDRKLCNKTILRLLVILFSPEPPLVVIEYVPFGDLLGFLRKSRGLKDAYYVNLDVLPRTNFTTSQLLTFAWQIADGMDFLSSHKVRTCQRAFYRARSFPKDCGETISRRSIPRIRIRAKYVSNRDIEFRAVSHQIKLF